MRAYLTLGVALVSGAAACPACHSTGNTPAPGNDVAMAPTATPLGPESGAAVAVDAAPGTLADAYRGTIGNLPVVMRLERSGATLSGSYFYEKNGGDLALAGTLDAGGADFSLSERSGSSRTGELRAHLGPDGVLTGTWSAPGGAKSLPLHLAPIARSAAPESALVFRKHLQFSEPVVGEDGGRGPGSCKGDTWYPEVFGLPTGALERALNEKLAPNADEQPPKPCDHAVESSGDFGVSYDAHGILSVRMAWEVTDSQAAHPSSAATSLNLTLRDGKPLALFGDVFERGSAAKVQALLAPQIEKAARGDADAKSVLEDALTPPFDDFVLEPTGVRVFVLNRLPHAFQALDQDGFELPYHLLSNAHGRAAAVFP